MLEAFQFIPDLIFSFRNKFINIRKLAQVIYTDNIEIENIIDLFCHQAYENILNPQNDEFLVICTYLLADEINKLSSPSSYSFLDSSFVGKLISRLNKKHEVTNYLSMTLNDLISNIENMSDHFMELSVFRIHEYIKAKAKAFNEKSYVQEKKKCLFTIDNEYLTKRIKKSNFINNSTSNKFKYNYNNHLKNSNNEYNLNTTNTYNKNEYINNIRYLNNLKSSSDLSIVNNTESTLNNEDLQSSIKIASNLNTYNPLDILNDKKNSKTELVLEEVENMNDLVDLTDNTNRDFTVELTSKEVKNYMLKSKDNKNMFLFFENQLKRINNDNNMFSNKKIINIIKNLPSFSGEVLRRYKENFEKIKDYTDIILTNIYNNISTIPYYIRSICKIINGLIHKKFPYITVYERNSILGHFLFNNIIIPILINPDLNAIVTSNFISEKTKVTLYSLSKILKKINLGNFFESCEDSDYTLFNHYIIEITPGIINLYDNIINIKLPSKVEELISDYCSNNKNNKNLLKEFNIDQNNINYLSNLENLLNNKNLNINSIAKNKINIGDYDYFKYHPEEIIHIQCICYSVKDANLLLKTVKKNINIFKSDEIILRAYNKSNYQESFLNKLEKDSSSKKFMLAYKVHFNPTMISFLEQKTSKQSFFFNNVIDNSIVDIKEFDKIEVEKIKYCIKLILKNLNIINPRNYSHLNYADSTDKFFESLNEVVKFEEFSLIENSNKIPLNWYSLYLTSNLSNISNNYRCNNYSLLYEEIIKEEKQEIEFLKEKSNIIIASFGMFDRCAEKAIEQVKIDASKINKIIKFIKMKRFINKTQIEVCVRQNKKKECHLSTRNRTKTTSTSFFSSMIFGNKSMPRESNNNINNYYSESNDDLEPSIIIKSKDECIHKRLKYLDELNEGNTISAYDNEDYVSNRYKNTNNKNQCHANYVNEFIRLFVKFPEIKEDISKGEQNHNISTSLSNYLSILRGYLIKDELFKNSSEELTNEIIDEIENYIIKKIYRRVFPEKDLPEDKNFYEKTNMLTFITPENMDINKRYLNEAIWINAVEELNKIDNEKSPISKLNCVIKAVNIIINCIRFCTGKFDEGYSVEDFMPILNYIIIKSKPKRLISNFNFINLLLDDNKQKGVYGNVLTNLNFSIAFILNINHITLNMTKDEFESKIYNHKIKKIDDILNK